jgi:hypothetical protein
VNISFGEVMKVVLIEFSPSQQKAPSGEKGRHGSVR